MRQNLIEPTIGQILRYCAEAPVERVVLEDVARRAQGRFAALADGDEELTATLKDVRKHLFDLRFQSATDRLETPSEITKARRDVARILTIQGERAAKAVAK